MADEPAQHGSTGSKSKVLLMAAIVVVVAVVVAVISMSMMGSSPLEPSGTKSLTVSIAGDTASIKITETMLLTVTVTDGTNPVSGASVSLNTTGGTLSTSSGTTDASGKMTTTFKCGTAGLYWVTATASKQGYDQGSKAKSVIVEIEPGQ